MEWQLSQAIFIWFRLPGRSHNRHAGRVLGGPGLSAMSPLNASPSRICQNTLRADLFLHASGRTMFLYRPTFVPPRMLQLDTLLLSMTSEVVKRASRVERGAGVQRVSLRGSGKRRKEVQTSATRIPAPPVILMVFFLDKGRGGMLGRADYSQRSVLHGSKVGDLVDVHFGPAKQRHSQAREKWQPK
jgi:hypothetical protein